MGIFVTIMAIMFMTCIVVDLIVLNFLVMKLLDFKESVEEYLAAVSDWMVNTSRVLGSHVDRLSCKIKELLAKLG